MFPIPILDLTDPALKTRAELADAGVRKQWEGQQIEDDEYLLFLEPEKDLCVPVLLKELLGDSVEAVWMETFRELLDSRWVVSIAAWKNCKREGWRPSRTVVYAAISAGRFVEHALPTPYVFNAMSDIEPFMQTQDEYFEVTVPGAVGISPVVFSSLPGLSLGAYRVINYG